MADTVTLKRIIDLVTQSDIDSGVYTIIDSTTGAVKKYPIGSLICSIAPIFDATADYTAGQYCNYNGQLYQFESDHDAGDWDGSDTEAVILSDMLEDLGVLPGEIAEIITELGTKADKDGTYSDMTAGLAEQLLSDVQTTDKKPYLFRRTGADATREFDCLVGGSVVGNQLVTNGNFADGTTGWSVQNAGNGSISAANNELTYTIINPVSNAYGNCVKQAVATTANHKYLFIQDVYVPKAATVNEIYLSSNRTVDVPSGWNHIEALGNASASESNVYFGLANASGKGFVADDIYKLKNINVIDLTAMFGSTIADHAYTLEQQTAGSGVAWLKSYGFFAGYQVYNAGAMVHVSGVEAHVMTEFNQWDEQWELGDISGGSGSPTPSNNYIRSKNFCPCVPNASYYFKVPGNTWVFWYRADKSYISNVGPIQDTARTAPNEAHYFKISNAGTTYNNDICINLSNPAKNGQYKPYAGNSYTLDDTLTLRGIPKLSNGELYYDGDTYASDGTVTRNAKLIDLGTLSWTKGSRNQDDTGFIYRTELNDIVPSSPAVCDKYALQINGTFAWETTKKGMFGVNAQYIIFADEYEDAAAFKAAVSGTYLVYLTQTPTTESATPYQSPQICDPDGTEQYVTDGIPVGHETQYPANLKGEIERVMVQVPKPPTSNGTYKLTCTVSSGGASYEWAADS